MDTIMNEFTHRLIYAAPGIRQAISHEPDIVPDFSGATIKTVVALLFCLMWNGIASPREMQSYLDQHGCRFDHETILFLLNVYDGTDPFRHFWTSNDQGNFEPLFDAVQAAEKYFFGAKFD
jgi:hypothetical protein